MSVVWLHSKFHTPNSEDSLVIVTKPITPQQLSYYNRSALHSKNTTHKLHVSVHLFSLATNITPTRQDCIRHVALTGCEKSQEAGI
jgi:hypothetical protein